MSTFVVGHDFSPCGKAAAREAARDAAVRGGRILLLHAYHVPRIPEGWKPAEFRRAIVADAEYQLGEAAKSLQAAHPGLEVVSMVREGEPALTLLEVAGEANAERIVLGTHSRSHVEERTLGSVAQRVMRRADVPVLVVKAELI